MVEITGTPIGQLVLIGNFRRRLARELLVVSSSYERNLFGTQMRGT